MEIPAKLQKFGAIFGKGIIADLTPQLAKGGLCEIMRREEVGQDKATRWVETNQRLWNLLNENEQQMFRKLADRAGNIDWLTAEWVIDSIKGEFPAVASLFLGWKKANNWLGRQVRIIKEEISKGVT